MANYQIFDLDGATTVFPVNSFGAVEKSQLSLKLTDEDGVASYIAADQWSVNGYGEDSESITITWANAVNYTAPATLRIVKSVRTDMLATFGSGPTTDKKLQDEFANIITNMIIPMLGTNNSTADLLFGSGNWTDDVNGNWDGSDTISIGGDTNIVDILTTHETRLDTAETTIADHETRLDTAEPIIATHTAQLADTQTSTLKENLVASINNLARQIASGVGLPTPATSATNAAADGGAPLYILGADNISGAPEWIDLRNQTLPQSQPVDADLTAIAALSPTNDDILQRKSGAWVNRTMTQLRADLLAIENATIVCGHWNGEMSSVTSPFAQAYYERDVTVVAGAPYTSTVGLMFSAPFRWVTGMPTKIKVTADYQLVGTSDSGGTSTIKLQARIIELNALTSSMNVQVAAVAYSVLDTVDLNTALEFSFGNSLSDTTIKTATTGTLTFDTSKVYAVQFVFPVVVYGNGNARIRLYGYTAQWAV